MIQQIIEYNREFVKKRATNPILPANTLTKNWRFLPVWIPG